MPRNVTMSKSRSCPLGEGCKFRKLEGQLKARGAQNPRALAAWIGRRKYGSAKFAAMAAHGRKYH